MSSTYSEFDETSSRTVAQMRSHSLNSNNGHSLLKKNAMISKLDMLREHNQSSMRMPPALDTNYNSVNTKPNFIL